MSNIYIDLAKNGRRMAFGADLEIKSNPNHYEILTKGNLLGQEIIKSTKKYSDPLALPYMDLKLEKEYLLTLLDIPEDEIEKYIFSPGIDNSVLDIITKKLGSKLTPRIKATCSAITYVKDNSDLYPAGMCIGPFSLLMKLMQDPILAVFMASMGISGQEDTSVNDLEILLEISKRLISCYVQLQIDAGAEAIVICEPAANNVYISPDTLKSDNIDIFDKLVIEYNKPIVKMMENQDVDLILHDCGELNEIMIRKLCLLKPKVLSLGSTLKLWEAAKFVPRDIVLFGNLPTKQFFMDDIISNEDVVELTKNLDEKMRETKHPFIMGSECDVLSVRGSEDTIIKKLELMLDV